MLANLRIWLASDSAKRAARTFVIAFVGILVPGVLGFLNAVTEWARSEGQAPLPDATSLAYLAVAAIAAGVIAVVNALWNIVEDATGHKLLRTNQRILGKAAMSPLSPRKHEQGISDAAFVAGLALAAAVVVLIVVLG